MKARSLALYAATYGGTTTVLKLTGFLIFMWFAYVLSVEEYAAFGLLYALQSAVTTLAIAGIYEGVVGVLHKTPAMPDRSCLNRSANATFAVMLVPTIIVVTVPFLIYRRNPLLTDALIFYTLIAGLITAYTTLQGQLTRLDERHLLSLSFSFLPPFSGFISGAAAFYFERNIQAFMFGSAAGMLACTGFLYWFRVKFPGFIAPWIVVREIIGRAPPFIAIAFIGWLGGYGNNYIVETVFASQQVAQFTFLFTLSAILQIVASSLNQVWSPRLIRLLASKPIAEVERLNRRFSRALGIVLGAFGGVIVAVYPSMIDLIGGKLLVYKPLDVELLLMLSAYIVLSPWWHCQNYYHVYGMGTTLMSILLVTGAIAITLMLGMMFIYGPVGIYFGIVMQSVLRSSAIIIVSKMHWPVNVAWDGMGLGLALVLCGFSVSWFFE